MGFYPASGAVSSQRQTETERESESGGYVGFLCVRANVKRTGEADGCGMTRCRTAVE